MQCLALDDATGMAQSSHAGGQRQVKHQAAADRPVLPENRSIALGNLHVHSRIPRRLVGIAGSVMLCWRVP
jgi:hypothetical protein